MSAPTLPLPFWAIAGISIVMLIAVLSTAIIATFHLLGLGLYETTDKPAKDDYLI